MPDNNTTATPATLAPETAPVAADAATDTGKAEAAPAQGKLFTQDELDSIISRRFAKLQQDSEKKIAEAVTEAQRLAKMNAEERAAHERQKAEDALKTREQDITRRELRAQAIETLADRGLPRELFEILPYTNADDTNDAINAVEKVFRAAVEKAVTERLRGDAPRANNPRTAKEKTLEEEIRDSLYRGRK